MKKGWELKNIGEICTVIAGQSPEGKYYNTEQNGLPFYQGKKEFTAKYLGNPTKWTSKTTKEAIKSDILMSVRAPVGPVNFSTQKICIGRGLAAIRVNRTITKEYLYNFLVKYENEITGNTGAVFNSINKSQIEAIEIPLPTLPEQKRIVTILDKAFTSIDKAKANAEKNLANVKELFESYLNGIFANPGEDWEEKKLGNLGTLTSSKRIFKKEYVTSGVPFYRSKEIKELAHNKKISLELFITNEKYNEIKSKFEVPQAGDILLTAVGTIGEMYVVKNNDTFYFKDGNIMWLRNFKALDTFYLKYALTSFVKQLQSMSQGSAYNALTIEKLKKYSVPVPSMKEQKKIVQNLDVLSTKTKKIEAIYQQKIDDLDELKKSILKKAFEGAL